MAYIEFVDREGEMRPAKECDERTAEAIARSWGNAKVRYLHS
jgi:hypothetical protein